MGEGVHNPTGGFPGMSEGVCGEAYELFTCAGRGGCVLPILKQQAQTPIRSGQRVGALRQKYLRQADGGVSLSPS